MTITSPNPGLFISRPSWIGSGAIGAAHTPGNPGFNLHRRTDSDTIAATLAIEEAYWERAYFWFRNPAPRTPGLANFFIYNGYRPFTSNVALAFPAPPVGSPYAPEMPYSRPQDRAFSTRRIYRPALEWMLKNAFWSPTFNAPNFCNFLCDMFYVSDSATPMGPERIVGSTLIYPYSTGADLSSSLLGDTTPALPSLPWTATADVLTALLSWHGGHTLNACANDGIFRNTSPDLNPAAITPIVATLVSIGSEANVWPSGWIDSFYAAHQVSALGSFGSIISSAFGRSFDYSILFDDARRLWFDRLGAYCQAMAAIDRTYCEQSADVYHYDNLAVITQYKVTGAVSGTIPASAIDWSSGRPVVQSAVQVTWGATSHQQSTATSQDYGRGFVIAAVQEGKCVSNADSEPIPLLQCYPSSSKIGELLDHGAIPAIGYVPFTITPPTLSWSDALHTYLLSYDIKRTDTGYAVNVVEPAQFTPPAGTLPVTIEGDAEYKYWLTSLSLPDTANIFPGGIQWQADVVREVEVCGFFSIASAESLWDIFYHYAQPKKVRIARGAANTQMGHEGLFATWRSENIEKVRTDLAADYPFEIGNLSVLESRLDQAMAEAKQYVSFAPQVAFAPGETVQGAVTGTSANPTITFQTTTGDGYLGSVLLNLGTEGTASRPIPSLAFGITDHGGAVRVDWRFNTLRLNS